MREDDLRLYEMMDRASEIGIPPDACFADGVIQIEPVGTAELKNISKPVDLFAVTQRV